MYTFVGVWKVWNRKYASNIQSQNVYLSVKGKLRREKFVRKVTHLFNPVVRTLSVDNSK